jgi:hypothetical protein
MNDGYGKLVSRFPHPLSIMVLSLPHLTLLFHEHTLLALMNLITPAFLTGLPHLPNHYHVNQLLSTIIPSHQ